MGVHDDPQGIGITMGVPPGTPTIAHLVASTPFLIVVLNSVVAGAIAAVVLVRFARAEATLTLIGAVLVAVLVLLAHMNYARRRIRQGESIVRPMFPTPSVDDSPAKTPGA
jgi:hypothetical protein